MLDPDSLLAAYRRVRARTLALCAPLTAEDQVVQASVDASPTKWHLAHTTWFFEDLVLGELGFDPAFRTLFNSYYEALGQRIERGRRGLVTRPDLARIHAYRSDVDARIERALTRDALDAGARSRLELGLHHEQQHQELILTDIKLVLGGQPLAPAYREASAVRASSRTPGAIEYRTFAGGIIEIGASKQGFAFDNERPRHRAIVPAFALANRPIVNAEVLGFIAEGGYREPRLWLSDGWDAIRRDGWHSPMYWREDGALYTLGGVRAIDPSEPACHLSYYEADALARWLGGRLPTELEWEVASADLPIHGQLADDDRFHPAPSRGAAPQMFGDVWQWTSSAYAPYPGFRPLPGALGEYNGKFMSGQQVLRGGSCLTPRDHIRATYRNFFPPAARWQMTGARVAKDMT